MLLRYGKLAQSVRQSCAMEGSWTQGVEGPSAGSGGPQLAGGIGIANQLRPAPGWNVRTTAEGTRSMKTRLLLVMLGTLLVTGVVLAHWVNAGQHVHSPACRNDARAR